MERLPEEVDKEIEDARRVLSDFWRYAIKMYASGELPQSFFSEDSPWMSRAVRFRKAVEPIDIANYYRWGLWRWWLPGQRHYFAAKTRPEYLVFLEARFAQMYPNERMKPMPPYTQQLADAVTRAEVPQELDQALQGAGASQA
ncbi:hypothetical protein WJX81_005400 [Elliptochloris bilobata]|uniref:EDS1 EP domain-containing protein n=1 Tax=Elliptochloris bilobata TaxID=381761 RepID=A0AAW1QW94_9CHLO